MAAAVSLGFQSSEANENEKSFECPQLIPCVEGGLPEKATTIEWTASIIRCRRSTLFCNNIRNERWKKNWLTTKSLPHVQLGQRIGLEKGFLHSAALSQADYRTFLSYFLFITSDGRHRSSYCACNGAHTAPKRRHAENVIVDLWSGRVGRGVWATGVDRLGLRFKPLKCSSTFTVR